LIGPITFDIPGRPVPKGRPRFDPRSGRAYTPKRTREYEDGVAWCAVAAGVRLTPGTRVKIDVVAYLRRRPWPDADNVLKSALDGIQKGFPEWNDRDVVGASIHLEEATGQQFMKVTVTILEEQ
jgi:crossover junction endodeoxyribonuclease RusA